MSAVPSHVPTGHKTAQGAHASHGRSKAHAGAGGGAGASGDFSSLMLNLGAQDLTDANLALGSAGGLTDTTAQVDASLLLAQSSQLGIGLPAELATGGQRGGSFAKSADGVSAAALSATQEAGQSLDALRTKAQLRAEGKDTASAADKDASNKSLELKTDAEKAQALDASTLDQGKSALKDADKAHRESQKTLALDDSSKQVKVKAEALNHDLKLKLAQHMASAHADATARTDAGSQTALVQSTGQGDPVLQQAERMKERLALKQVGDGEGGAWGYQALAEAGRIHAPSEAGATAGLPPEVSVAQQVSYWVSHGIQNAELKLSGFGDDAVKVNISMQGNEANVTFQSDQMETRQLLENSISHLKDLLGNEGLMLSSVSVGTSGSGGAGARHAPAAPPARQVRVGAVQMPMLESVAQLVPRSSTGTSGRALDLFV